MVKRIREPFGKAGLIVAMVALVAAVGGSAIAANTASDSGKRNAMKKEAKGVTVAQVRKIAKQEAQKFANSNPGAPGLQGPAGANGSDGAQGPKGDNGSSGSNGASVTLAAATGCSEGGTKLSVGSSSQEVCNGDKGDPWSAGGTLPSGSTETGAWATSNDTTVGSVDSISFTFRLADPLDGAHVVSLPVGYEGEDESTPAEENCPGNAANPKAAPGYLCVYLGTAFPSAGYEGIFDPANQLEAGAATTGAVIAMQGAPPGEPGVRLALGTWAVTAP